MLAHDKKIKKYAINRFDAQLKQALFFSLENTQTKDSTIINEDEEIKSKNTHGKSSQWKRTVPRHYHQVPGYHQVQTHTSTQFKPRSKQTQSLHCRKDTGGSSMGFEGQPSGRQNDVRMVKRSKIRKNIYFNLNGFAKQKENQQDFALDKKIDQLRNIKLEGTRQNNIRSLSYSHQKQRSQRKSEPKQTLQHPKKAQVPQKCWQSSSPIPNQPKKQKSPNPQKNTNSNHFIQMQVIISSNSVMGIDNKHNIMKKEDEHQNIFYTIRKKKQFKIFNQRNVSQPLFRVKLGADGELGEDGLFQDHDNKRIKFFTINEKSKHITLDHLIKYKEAMENRKENIINKQFCPETEELKIQKPQVSWGNMSEKNKKIEENSSKPCKKSISITIQNQQHYNQLIHINQQDYEQADKTMTTRKRKKILKSANAATTRTKNLDTQPNSHNKL